MAGNAFVRAHGLGNDYLVMRERDLSFPLTPQAIRLICDRHFGVGSDGILLETGSEAADVGLRILNPDGSEAEKSGNGLRIFGHFLARRGRLADRVVVQTLGGLAEIRLLPGGLLRVDMGEATFQSERIPATGPGREIVAEPVEVGGRTLTVTAVNVGNPHCVTFGDFDLKDLETLGPQIERHPMFPNRINVQLARPEGPQRIRILIWERGAGHTVASGSSATAAAVAAVRLGLAKSPVTVGMEGGELIVEMAADGHVYQTGPAEEVAEGALSEELLRHLR